jgi:hypothetical protein
VLLTSMDAFEEDIKKSAGQKVAFDAIVGRNIIGSEPDKPALIKRMLSLVAKDGRVVLAETVHSQGQRLSGLLSFKNMPKDFMSRFAAVEEKLFADKSDALVNWDPASLEKKCKALFPCTFGVHSLLSSARRRISPEMVEHWFRPQTAGGRMPLGGRLEEDFGKKAAAEIKKLMHLQLDNADIPWKTSVAIIRISAARA